MNRMNSQNDLCHDDSNVNIVPCIIIIIIIIVVVVVVVIWRLKFCHLWSCCLEWPTTLHITEHLQE